MLTKKYLTSTKNLPGIMQKITSGTAPERFTTEHLKNIGFGGSQDRAVVPLLKDLGFLSSDGRPTQQYHDYRNTARSRKVMGEALREAYTDLFHINAQPSRSDKKAIEGMFKSTHNVTDRVAELQTMTFFALLELADISEDEAVEVDTPKISIREEKPVYNVDSPVIPRTSTLNLRYNIEIHLPATKDIEVYNAIFKSLREHLGE